MGGYMPQRVFEVGAASIAKVHLLKGISIAESAAALWAQYSTSYIDDGVEEDLKSAAVEAIKTLEEMEEPSPIKLLHHFQYFTINYDEEGKPRKKKLFGGTLFSRDPQNKNRKQDFLQRLAAYYAGVRASIMPLAPEGWVPGA